MELIGIFRPGEVVCAARDIEAKTVYKGSGRQILEINLRRPAVLSKHRAAEPITVFCLAGKGRFLAGEDLSEEIALEPGTLLTLEPGTLHEVGAETDLRLLVTKFKSE